MTNHYTRTAITLHWAIALLIFAAFPLGVYMHDLPLSPDKLQLYSYHKWIGMAKYVPAVSDEVNISSQVEAIKDKVLF